MGPIIFWSQIRNCLVVCFILGSDILTIMHAKLYDNNLLLTPTDDHSHLFLSPSDFVLLPNYNGFNNFMESLVWLLV